MAVVMLAAGGCATNPVTGESQFTLMSEQQEIQTGRELDAQVRREMGLYADEALQQYVDRVGQRLAAVSHRPDLPWHFAVVDQTAVNAFALPGGYIYLTRGILPFLDSEAELAGVLGHEIGHVTARHAAKAYTRSTSAGVGLAVLGIFVPEARPAEGLAETALGVLFLKYGRDDELQADRLGAEYAAGVGWDPRGVAGMLTTLSRLDEASTTSRGVPGWLSTHPDPGDRVEQVQSTIAEAERGHPSEFTINRDAFLGHLDGLVFGDDPKAGVVRGSELLHAGLRFRVTFPEGWVITNAPSQVVAEAPGGTSTMLLRLVQQPSGRLETIAVSGMASAGFRLEDGGPSRIGDLQAFVGTYRGRTNAGETLARAAHIEYEANVYFLAGLAPEAGFASVEPAFARSIRSFRPLGAAEAARIRPYRVDLSVARASDTWASLAAGAGDAVVPASTLAIMNHHDPGEPPRPGERIKIVVIG